MKIHDDSVVVIIHMNIGRGNVVVLNPNIIIQIDAISIIIEDPSITDTCASIIKSVWTCHVFSPGHPDVFTIVVGKVQVIVSISIHSISSRNKVRNSNQAWAIDVISITPAVAGEHTAGNNRLTAIETNDVVIIELSGGRVAYC